jgi:hypothetical protein
MEIADLRHAGLNIRQIAHRLGRAPSTGLARTAPQRDREWGKACWMPTVARPRVAPAIIGDASRPTAN